MLVLGAGEMFVQAIGENKLARRWQPVRHFALLLRKRHRRMRQSHVIKTSRLGNQILFRKQGRLVCFGHKLSAHMTRPNAQFHHDGHVGSFRQLETLLDHVDHLTQLWPGVKQAHARLQSIGMCAFLNDAGTLAVIFAHHNEHATGDARR